MKKFNDYQSFIYLSRYSRWLADEKRRETWPETVKRYLDFMVEELNEQGAVVNCDTYSRVEEAILNLDVMPSMRALMSAGPAAKRDNMCIYNCSYIPINDTYAFDEVLNVLMCGTGVGFSVEKRNVERLPQIADHFEHTDTRIVVADSREGWARALRQHISLLYAGQIPSWDVSRVRPAGARLKTMGGRASGPEPLTKLFAYLVEKFQHAAGRRLTSVECHDIVCRIADCVIVGGVRRSALISLSDLDDHNLRSAKFGQWWEEHPERALANNSAVYTSKPSVGQFLKEWTALYESKSGERGIFNREAAKRGVPDRRDSNQNFGVNPCGEILLRPYGLCNLTEVVCRPNDTWQTLQEKVEIATIIGTWQSSLTNFKHVRKLWKKNAEEERLLGVSLTGVLDCPLFRSKDVAPHLEDLRTTSIVTNEMEAERIGINPSVAITCVKPSGTVSQLVDSASGMHARYAGRYIRRVRQDAKDPLTDFMKEAGFPWEPEKFHPNDQVVFSFPMKAPEGAVTMADMTAIDQLELWLLLKRHWCEHNPSVTVTVKEDEWVKVGAWVYDHFDEVLGISFLPDAGGHTYVQAPYEEIKDVAEFQAYRYAMPQDVQWNELKKFERGGDGITESVEYACTAGQCSI